MRLPGRGESNPAATALRRASRMRRCVYECADAGERGGVLIIDANDWRSYSLSNATAGAPLAARADNHSRGAAGPLVTVSMPAPLFKMASPVPHDPPSPAAVVGRRARLARVQNIYGLNFIHPLLLDGRHRFPSWTAEDDLLINLLAAPGGDDQIWIAASTSSAVTTRSFAELPLSSGKYQCRPPVRSIRPPMQCRRSAAHATPQNTRAGVLSAHRRLPDAFHLCAQLVDELLRASLRPISAPSIRIASRMPLSDR